MATFCVHLPVSPQIEDSGVAILNGIYIWMASMISEIHGLCAAVGHHPYSLCIHILDYLLLEHSQLHEPLGRSFLFNADVAVALYR